MSDSLEPLSTLLDIMARLRDPVRGCPWDREQTFATIAPYTIEEAYEVADAIDGAGGERTGGAERTPEGKSTADAERAPDPARLKDELGDLLFQVVFHARLAEERGWFGFADVARAIGEKLERRHPHVFGDPGVCVDAAGLPRQWEEQKARERAAAARRRGESGSPTLADVPLALPALMRAAKLGRRAGRVGFDWNTAAGVRDKVQEELAELDAAGHGQGDVAEELGDLLFAAANWGRHLGVDPETALRAANAKFERRFASMERLAAERGIALTALSAAEWDALWREAKTAAR
jgi:MazG family protein